MGYQSEASGHLARPAKRTPLMIGALCLAVLGAIALDTTVVRIGSEQDARQQGFSAERFGTEKFPEIRSYVIEHAVDAKTLFDAATADKKAAGEKYGVMAGIAPVMPVKLSGIVGEGKSGTFYIAIDGMEGAKVRVQTGPAVNGTDLRDATGTIAFGDFTNQIEYQNAGAGINNAMKAEVLADLDRDTLTGKTIEVTGVFTMISPKNWLVTPVELSVQ